MPTAFALLFLRALVQQIPSANDQSILIEKLGSEQIEDREAAYQDLLKLGRRAIPLLERASASRRTCINATKRSRVEASSSALAAR